MGAESLLFFHVSKAFEEYWQGMRFWTGISGEAKEAIISGAKKSLGGRNLSELTQWRDEKLVKLLKGE